MIDRKAFFNSVRSAPFGGRLAQGQANGCEIIITEFERRDLLDLRWLAYELATAKWETDHTMQPIKERGGNSYLTRMYDITGARPSLAKRNGNIHQGDGVKYCGRGFVQLTWHDNYAEMGALWNKSHHIEKIDLVRNPDLALRPDIAAFIMFEGMLKADSYRGDFTGHSLEEYFSNDRDDPINARRIINGLDHARDIAIIHRDFLAALKAAMVDDRAADMPLPQAHPAEAVGDQIGDPGGPQAVLDEGPAIPAEAPGRPGEIHDKAAIIAVQMKLREIGYPEVGEADGVLASYAEGAILAVRNDWNKDHQGDQLPLYPYVDKSLLAALPMMEPRPIGQARAEATAAEIAPQIESLQQSQKAKWLARLGVGAGGGGMAIDQLSGTFESLRGVIKPIQGVLSAAPPWFWLAAVAIACGVAWYLIDKSQKSTVKLFQDGRLR